MDHYATIKCPICKSTIRFKVTTASSGPLLCPVCSEGEIEFHTALKHIFHYKSKFLFVCNEPQVVYNDYN